MASDEKRKLGKAADNLYWRLNSPFLHVVWHQGRRKHWKSTKTANVKEAKRIRDEIFAHLRSSALTRDERVTYEQLRQILIDHFTIRDMTASLRSFEVVRAKHLDTFFGKQRAIDIAQGGMIGRYIAQRKRERASNASINRETQALHQMFALAARDEHRLLSRGLVPRIERLREDNRRRGVINDSQRLEIVRLLPDWARGPIAALNLTGWRVEAILSRKRTDVAGDFLLLESDASKNREDWKFPIVGELKALIDSQVEQTVRDERELNRMIPWLFHRDGNRIKYDALYRQWKQAATDAGYPGKLMHDFRRTVATRFDEKGIPREVAKAMMGHKTDQMFSRYVQTFDQRMLDAAKTLSADEKVSKPVAETAPKPVHRIGKR